MTAIFLVCFSISWVAVAELHAYIIDVDKKPINHKFWAFITLLSALIYSSVGFHSSLNLFFWSLFTFLVSKWVVFDLALNWKRKKPWNYTGDHKSYSAKLDLKSWQLQYALKGFGVAVSIVWYFLI